MTEAKRWFPAAFIVGLLVAGYLAPLPYSPLEPNTDAITRPPSAAHFFGTDLSGFDVFARDIASARYVLPIVIVATLLSVLFGVPLGLLASTGSRSSEFLVRLSDALQAFPLVVLAITIVTLAGNRLSSVVLAIAFVSVPRFLRLVRSEAMIVRKLRYVEAAVSVGCSRSRVLLRHVLPNTIDVILAQASLAAAYGIIIIAALNFLGIGVTPPTPTWGSMIRDGAQMVAQGQWWTMLFPTVTVLMVVASFNAIANSLRSSRGQA